MKSTQKGSAWFFLLIQLSMIEALEEPISSVGLPNPPSSDLGTTESSITSNGTLKQTLLSTNSTANLDTDFNLVDDPSENSATNIDEPLKKFPHTFEKPSVEIPKNTSKNNDSKPELDSENFTKIPHKTETVERPPNSPIRENSQTIGESNEDNTNNTPGISSDYFNEIPDTTPSQTIDLPDTNADDGKIRKDEKTIISISVDTFIITLKMSFMC